MKSQAVDPGIAPLAGVRAPPLPAWSVAPAHGPAENAADALADQVLVTAHRQHTAAGTAQWAAGPQTAPQGQPGIPQDLQHAFQARTGFDFSAIRIRADPEAADAADRLDAMAFCVGDTIAFARGHWQPHSADARALLAHELAHVVLRGHGAAAQATVYRRGRHTAKGGSKKTQKKALNKGTGREIQWLRCTVGSLKATAILTDGVTALSINLKENTVAAGEYVFERHDDPATPFTEYRPQDGRTRGFVWLNTTDAEMAERLRVTVQEAPFSYEDYAQQQLDEVPDAVKQLLSVRGGEKLKTPEDKLGFAQFVAEMRRRGVTEEELLTFRQAQLQNIRGRRIRWSTEWLDAVDLVLGARGDLERRDAALREQATQAASGLDALPEDLVQLEKLRRTSAMVSDRQADAFFEREGAARAEFAANRNALIQAFDERLRLETAVALQRFDGQLRLAQQRLLVRPGHEARLEGVVTEAGRPAVRELKAASKKAQASAGRANVRAYLNDPLGLSKLEDIEGVHDEAKAAQDVADAQKSRYLTRLEALSGLPVQAWRGFDVDAFFGAKNRKRSEAVLRTFVNARLRRIAWAQKEIRKDASAAYRFDVIVSHAKSELGIAQGSNAEAVIDDEVDVRTDRSLAAKLLDILSIALIFVPGGAVVAVARVAVGGAQLMGSIDEEVTKQLTHEAGLASEGGSALWPALDALGAAGDVADLARPLRGAKLLEADAGQAARLGRKEGRVAAEGTEAATDTRRLDDILARGGDDLVEQLTPKLRQDLLANADQARVSSLPGYSVEVPLEAKHTALRKTRNSWCVHSAEVCGIPVTDDIELAIDRSLMPDLVDAPKGEYLRAPKTRRAVKPADGSASQARRAREQFSSTHRPAHVARFNADSLPGREIVRSGEDIHHAIELQVLDLYPGAFRADDLNAFDNMRVIPAETEKIVKASGKTVDKTRKQLHNSYIRWRWNQAYTQLDAEIAKRGLQTGTPAYTDYVRRYLADQRAAIDHATDQFFGSHKRGTLGLTEAVP